MYWADREGIYWSSLQEGTPQRFIAADARRPGKIEVDVAGGKMYWVDKRGETVQRSDLDGSNIERLPGEWGGSRAMDIALDLERGKIYSVGLYSGGDYLIGEVYRANLDGSNFEKMRMGVSGPLAHNLSLDTTRGYLYLGAWWGIYRIDLSVTPWEGVDSRQTILDWEEVFQTSWSSDFALDTVGNKVYWSDGSIWRSNTDGSDVELLFDTGSDHDAVAIAIDAENGKVYWAAGDSYSFQTSYGDLMRANMDGSQMEVVAEGEVVGIDLDLQGRKVYWTEARGTIHRANVDGTDVEELFAPNVRAPYSVALDRREGRIYWSDVLAGSILRAGLDGSNMEMVIGGLGTPKGISIEGSKLYWADSGTGKIQSAHLDGANMKDIVTEASDPDKVAVDLDHRTIFWTEPERSLIRRADLDGNHIEEYTVRYPPKGIALDVAREQIYWTWKVFPRGRANLSGPTGISRSNLDGTNVEDVCCDEDSDVTIDVFGDIWSYDFRAMALDPDGGKIYWTSMYKPHYQPWGEWPYYRVEAHQANLDGSNVRVLLPPMSLWWYRASGLKTWPPDMMGQSLALHLSRRTAVSTQSSVPTSTTLRSSYPNPFNGSTLISYTLATPGPVSLVVYNTLGQPVRTLVDQVQAPGLYSVPWQPAEALASGVYLYRLTTSDAVLTRRLALLR